MGAPARPDSAARAAPGAAAPVVQQAARPAPAAPANTSGLAIPPYDAESNYGAASTYLRRYLPMLDSTIVTLVEVFRNTSGQPLGGPAGPEALSQREKDRWSRCRDLYWDLTTYRDGLGAPLTVVMELTDNLAEARAAAVLDSALGSAVSDSAAVAECDNISSMIAAPGRWTPWDQQYQGAARRFYAGWYADIRNAHERARAFVVALNATLPPAQRLTVPPALQRNPPYAGAAPR
jgi:hypothetical protein